MTAGPKVPVNLAYWFVPLPEQIPLPHGFEFRFALTKPYDQWLEELETSHQHQPHDDEVDRLLLEVSLRVWQRTEPWSGGAFDQLAQVVRDAFPGIPGAAERSTSSSTSRPSTHVTIIEACVVFGADEPSADDLSDGFDAAIRCIRDLQRACYLLSKGAPTTLVSKESLPWAVPFVARRESEEDQAWPREFSIYLVNANFGGLAQRDVLGADALASIDAALDRLRPPFGPNADFRREAHAAMRRGDYTSAVVLAAVASELLLDDLLLHLMWEEGKRPEDAAAVFAGSGLIKRIRSEYHPRLGGQDWRTDAGPIQDWQASVAHPRHRVLHAGHQPALAEAQRAIQGLDRLEEFLAIEVTRKTARHPVTAVSLLAEPGLRRRNAFTKRVRKVLADPDQVPWRETFQRWHQSVARQRADAEGSGEAPDQSRASLLLVLQPNADPEWVLHDRPAGKAAPTNPESLPTGFQLPDNVDTLQAATDRDGTPRSILLVGVRGTPTGEWVEEHRLVPEASVMFDKRDRY